MKKNKHGEIIRSLAMVTQLGLSVLAPVFLCVAFGIFLDRQFGLSTVFLFLILGILAGGRNAYRLAKQVSSTEEKKDD